MKTLLVNYNKHYFGDFSVNLLSNVISVKGRHGLLTKKLRPLFFISSNFVFIYKQYFRLFISLLQDMLIGVNFKWYVELEMKGLGFKTFFSLNEQVYKIDIGYNHYIYCPLNINTVGIKTKKRSRFIIVYGIDKLEVFNLVWKILLFRPLTSYKFRGIKFRHKALKLKIGKKKQFF